MLLSSYKPSTRVYHEELDGTLNIANRKIDELGEEGSWKTPYYVGMAMCLMIEKSYEYVEYPQDFIKIFELMLDELEGEG